MSRRRTLAVCVALVGCGPSYSPNTYATSAVQQANKVDQGVIVGMRRIGISTSGAVGAVTGAAAGGVAGSQIGVGPMTPFTALSGSLIGGLAGSAAEHVSSNTAGWEYIVRKKNGALVSVTQKDDVPLALGQKVLVIAGNQARVVPDYTVNTEVAPKSAVPASVAPAVDARSSAEAQAAPAEEPAPAAVP